MSHGVRARDGKAQNRRERARETQVSGIRVMQCGFNARTRPHNQRPSRS